MLINFTTNWRRSFLPLLAIGLASLAILPIAAILCQIVAQGVPHFRWQLLVTLPTAVDTTTATGFVNNSLSGFAHAIVGTGLMVSLALLFSLPLGVITGIYLSEFPDRFAPVIRIAMGILSSSPSIVIGLFAYGVVVTRVGFSALAGGFALAFICLPIIALNTAEALQQVPAIYRTASLALGITPTATLRRIVIPNAWQGISTGVLLALARSAGETAPLLFTALSSLYFPQGLVGSPAPSLAVTIYRYASSPFPPQQNQAWTIALVLVVTILLLNAVANYVRHHHRSV
ncbi:MAG: phosphate ABC transporter permease PstA [Pseudanabaenaceae cyanobacterium]